MNPRMYKATVLLLVAAVLVVGIAWRLHTRPVASRSDATSAAGPAAGQPVQASSFPAVLDFGMGTCIPCKQMKPILDALKQEYAGRCRVEIIDITDRRDLADRYRINLIPTQIFLDASGKEVYRHEGFMPKADIVAKLREMGVE